MKNISHHVGELKILERLKNSINGNPRFRVYVAGFHCVTKPDSSLAYALSNYDGKIVDCHIGTHHGVATLIDVSDRHTSTLPGGGA